MTLKKLFRKEGVPTVAQWVKDVVLLQLWYRSQLQLGFDPWPVNFHMVQGAASWKRKTKKREKNKLRTPFLLRKITNIA